MSSGIEENPRSASQDSQNAPADGTCEIAWIDVMDADDLWIGDMVEVESEAGPLLLVNIKGAIFAYENRCPHNGSRLGKGELINGVIVCPNHRWEFCAQGGWGINPTGTQLNPYPVQIVGSRIQIGLRQI